MAHAPSRLAIAALLPSLLQPIGARAGGDGAPPVFSFSAFGTLGAAHSSERDANFTSSVFKPGGAGIKRAWSADVDTILGAQLAAKPSPEFSAVLQLVSEQNHDNSYRPHVEWANLKYQFTPDFSVRVGRTVLPVFLVTDSRKVGYANPWVRPPLEVYGLVALTSNDGADASLRTTLGGATNTIQVAAGRTKQTFPDRAGRGIGDAKLREVATLADTLVMGYATLHASYGRTLLTIEAFDPLFDGFAQFGPEGIAIADKYRVNARLSHFIGVGAAWDPGNWFVTGEWGRTHSRTVFGTKSGWYVTAGPRLGKFTPFVTYARAKANQLTDPGLNVAALPPSLSATAGELNAVLASVLNMNPAVRTISIGARWDFARNAALKVQFDRSRSGENSVGNFSDPRPAFQLGGKLDVVNVTLDFVF